MRAFFLILALALTSCDKPPEKPPLNLAPASFKDLPGWASDDMSAAYEALERSCKRILKKPADKKMGPLKAAGTYGDWQKPCRALTQMQKPNAATLRTFFEKNFIPHAVLAGEEETGLFTGYYEASLKGSKKRFGPYQIPLHTRPDDLVMVQLGDFRKDLKGRRIAGRVKGGKLKPYESRDEIVSGDWPHNKEILLWVDDAVDAFFVQIQGSGVVELAPDPEDPQETMRIGYAGQNGHPYYAIGRELIKREHLTRGNVSMRSIREWLEANPEAGAEIMNTNKSYVFFRELKGEGPVGGEGIALTAGRSLAVDRSLMSYGLPLWVDLQGSATCEPASESIWDKIRAYFGYEKEACPDIPRLQRLMVAQDTGGAIRGPVRGDVFFGYGEEAEQNAGHMKSKGRYWVLLPKP